MYQEVCDVSKDRPILGGMSEPRWLTASEDRAWRAYRLMRARLDLQLTRDLARDSALSDADYDVLSNLSDAQDHRCRLKDLAAQMLWSPSRLSHHITRMEQRGLVARRESPLDRRGAVVKLTADGWAVLQAAAPAHVESVRRHLIDLLTPQQIDALAEISETVVAHLNELDARAPGR